MVKPHDFHAPALTSDSLLQQLDVIKGKVPQDLNEEVEQLEEIHQLLSQALQAD